ncbi:spore maturation protein CgeB [Butyrivibrio sp. INlla18]|uniref:glycosyltransferase family protein n=1 Tax=Butyrivibrio sp. INlla18 TaxID=1520806 RepID=UPI00089028EA|nr:glycosyltransferase [Butyrivibrio sp. INlla18]SDA41850.1 spore maturation protein CgeB [Butyrivibrio sp. INlla18]
MNIIFYRYKSICEPDFIDAFYSLGINVIEDTDGMATSLTLDQKITNLGNLIADKKPLFVFSINYYPFISMLCEKLHVFYVAETVDCPVFEIFNTTIKNTFNRIFLFDKEQYNLIHSQNPDCIFHLPLGAACDRVSTLLGTTSDYKYDISFIGSLYNEKDPLSNEPSISCSLKSTIESMIDKQLDDSVFGYDVLKATLNNEIINELKEIDKAFYPSNMSVFDISDYVALCNYLCPHATYQERVKILNLIVAKLPYTKLDLFTKSNCNELSDNIIIHNGADSLKEMPFIFRQSKVNLNITTRSITSGLSQRIWDVLACQGFLITNYQPEIDTFFKDGKHLVTYKSYDELIDKIGYYLSHDKEREKIAKQGFEEVCAKSKVTNRVIEMISTIVNQ